MTNRISQEDLDKFPALKNGVFFVQADEISPQICELSWGLMSRQLRFDAQTGGALDFTIPAGWELNYSIHYDRPIELVIQEGRVSLGDIVLEKGDFLRLPAFDKIERISSSAGARVLMFFDGGIPLMNTQPFNEVSGETKLVKHYKDLEWVAGTLMKDVGIDDVPLKIKHYKNDETTGARTYIVAVKPGVVIPWEVHEVSEEVYVVDGDYTLAECFPSGSQLFDYTQGGYFYRPAGIAHNGPSSGTKSGVTMLIRTTGPLTVKILDKCQFDN